MTITRWGVALGLVLGFTSTLVAAPPSSPPSEQELQEPMEKMRKEHERMQQEHLERLRQTDPQLYEQQKASIERQKKITAILTDWQQKKISESAAESQLAPLIRQDSKAEIAALGERIARLEKRLEFLRKAKADPGLLVKKRLDQLLGRGLPTPEGPEGMMDF